MGRPGDVGVERPPDVLGTNICRLGSNKKYHFKTLINATDVATCIIATESVSCIVLTETSTYRIDYKNFNLQKWCQSEIRSVTIKNLSK